MIRLQAVNDVVILLKDKGVSDSALLGSTNGKENMYEIPEPFTGIIDSIGMPNEWKVGDHIAFQDVGGVYMVVDDREYVVITPDMIIGKF